MSIQVGDEQASECIDLNNNNMIDEETFLNDKQDSQPDDSFFRDLFNVYDTEKLGYILVENFIEISKQNMFDSFLGDEEKLKEWVQMLDPLGAGRIEYLNFVEGMTSLMSDKSSERYIEGQDLISRSRSSTFMEGETPVLQLSKNLTEEIYENYEPNTPDSSNKTSSNEYEYGDIDAESLTDNTDDFFGIDSSELASHRKSLSVRKSISMSGMMRNSKRLSMQHQIVKSSLLNLSMNDEKENSTIASETGNYEQIIEELEFKIKNLDEQNGSLKWEINEQINKNKYLSAENFSLASKIREFEDHNLELERKFQCQIQEENTRNQENLTKILAAQEEDKENFLNQITSLEKTAALQKLENDNNLKQISEMIKSCEDKDAMIMREHSKFKELEVDYANTLTELENLSKAHEKLKAEDEEQIKQLTKEIHDTRLLVENTQQEHLHQRKNTLYDESYYINQIQQLETENRLFKSEIDALNSNLNELNANIQIYKTNFQESKCQNDTNVDFLNRISSSDSFMDEFNNSKEDELLEKLIEERKNTQRLRDYVEELTSKILEINPAILEAKKPVSNNDDNRKDGKSPKKQEKSGFKKLLKLVN